MRTKSDDPGSKAKFHTKLPVDGLPSQVGLPLGVAGRYRRGETELEG